jgi:signal transduction histidine kinase
MMAMTLVIVLTTFASSSYFYTKTKIIIFDNLQKRGRTICENLSYSAKYGVLTEDTEILDELAAGVMQGEDVAYVIIQNEQGKTLAEKTAVDLPTKAFLKKRSQTTKEYEFFSVNDKFGNPIYNFCFPIMVKTVSLAEVEEGSIAEGQKEASFRGVVQVGLSLSNVLNKLRSVLQGIILLTLVVMAGGVVFSLFFVRIIMKPIQGMTEAAVRIASGDLSQRVEAESQDEIGQFAVQFNAMTSALKTRQEQLKESYKEISYAKDQLELRVQERTAELTAANDRLTKEIVRRERAEARKDQLLKELESANKELKDFAYIASHDLKAPLRGISTLAEWLAVDYADKFDEKGKKQIELLVGRTERMHNLIDGILQYSRVGKADEERVSVDLNQLVPEIIDLLGPVENINIEIENQLPTILFEKTRITQVFQNLLSNAIKYMDKPKGEIRIGCVKEDNFWKFGVSDNGPGIGEKNKDRIFQIFQTLAPRDQYESTGIGLTVVKKIVEIYGGKIWVESKLGKGSTFYFTVPVSVEELVQV